MCKMFLQLILIILIGLVPLSLSAQYRVPASYIPDDDIQAIPEEIPHFLEILFVEDEAGVLERTLDVFEDWNERREYAELWNLQSTGLYNTPGDLDRENFLKRQIKRYFNKRITGSLKRDYEDSDLYDIVRARGDTLEDSSDSSSGSAVAVSTASDEPANVATKPMIKFKFRTSRLLRGRLTMNIENPWIHCSTTFNINGRINMDFHRKIESIDLSTRVTLDPIDMVYTAEIDKRFADHFLARLSSRRPAAGAQTNNVVHLMYNKRF